MEKAGREGVRKREGEIEGKRQEDKGGGNGRKTIGEEGIRNCRKKEIEGITRGVA